MPPPSPTGRIANKENTFFGSGKAKEVRPNGSIDRSRPVLRLKSSNTAMRPALGQKVASRQQSLPLQRQVLSTKQPIFASRSSSFESSVSIATMSPSARPFSREKTLYPRPLHPIDFSNLDLDPEVAVPAPNLLDFDMFDEELECDLPTLKLPPLPDLDKAPDFDMSFDESDISVESI